MIEDNMFDNDCYAVFMEEEHEKEKRVRDNISRQALLESIKRVSVKGNVLDDDWVYRFIQEFPSAQPKTGKWIENDSDTWVCSKCGVENAYAVYRGRICDNYCPHCGADMRGEQDENY